MGFNEINYSRVSRAAEKLLGQPMFNILSKVQEMERQGRKIIHFEIGDPDFNTPKGVVNAACDALNNGMTHYTNSKGLYELREAVCEYVLNNRGFKPNIENVIITPGANVAIYYAIRCLANPGDDVVLSDPCFPTYTSVLNFCDVNPIMIPLKEENNFRIEPEEILKRITKKTKLIIINTPHNPCGSITQKEALDKIYDIAKDQDIFLLTDEIYSRMIYNKNKEFYSPSSRDHCKERTIIIDGFSKSFAMTGWRLGYVVGPEDVMDKFQLLLQTTSSCVSPFIQYAGCEALKNEQVDLENMMTEFKKRRDIIVNGLNSLPGVKCNTPDGAFYVFPNITGTGMNEFEFTELILKEAGVAVVPGSYFGQAGKGFVRLCYANSKENILKGINQMRECLERRMNMSC